MHRTTLADQEQRMNLFITNQNKKNDKVVGEVMAHKAEILAQQDLLKIQQDKATQVFEETRDFDSRLSALTQQIQLGEGRMPRTPSIKSRRTP